MYIDYVAASGQLAGDVWINHMQPYVWGWGCVKFIFSNPSSTSYAITCFNSSGGQISKISGSMTRNATIAIQWEFSAMGISSQNLNMILFHVNNLMAVDTLTMWYTLNYGTGTGGATTV